MTTQVPMVLQVRDYLHDHRRVDPVQVDILALHLGDFCEEIRKKKGGVKFGFGVSRPELTGGVYVKVLVTWPGMNVHDSDHGRLMGEVMDSFTKEVSHRWRAYLYFAQEKGIAPLTFEEYARISCEGDAYDFIGIE